MTDFIVKKPIISCFWAPAALSVLVLSDLCYALRPHPEASAGRLLFGSAVQDQLRSCHSYRWCTAFLQNAISAAIFES